MCWGLPEASVGSLELEFRADVSHLMWAWKQKVAAPPNHLSSPKPYFSKNCISQNLMEFFQGRITLNAYQYVAEFVFLLREKQTLKTLRASCNSMTAGELSVAH